MENNTDKNGSNTILLVIIIIILLIGGAFWWYKNYGTPEPTPEQNGGLQINIGAEGRNNTGTETPTNSSQ